MARIDKIYAPTKSEAIEFVNWCVVNDKHCLQTISRRLTDGLYYDSEYITNYVRDNAIDFPVSNFTQECDHYLIKYCEIPFVVERLKEQYGEDYEVLKNENFKPIHHNWKRSELATKYKVIKNFKQHNFRYKMFNGFFIDEIIGDKDSKWVIGALYNKADIAFDECAVYGGDVEWAYYSRGTKCRSIKAFIRYIKNLKLPKGLTIRASGCYWGQDYIIKTK